VKRIKFVGLDVHAETIAVAVAEQDGEVRSVGVIPNRCESVRKLVKKLGPVEELHFCYEASPTGYVLYWQLTALGAKCGGRSREDGPARCAEAGQELSSGRVDGSMGAGCGSRSLARSCKSTRSCQERPIAGTKSSDEVLVAAWEKVTPGSKSLDVELHELQVAVLEPREGEPSAALCGKSLDQPAQIVRGNSRRITIMRHRPANI
jgi:hypothetical protein